MGEPVPITEHQELTPADLRERILGFEELLLEHEQLDIPVIQMFCNGVYLRQITIPAGAWCTGKIHKHPCISIVLNGKMEVVTDEGRRIIEGPCVYESPAGVKRAGRALEDCTWITVHPWAGPELDEDLMARELCVDTFEELEHFQAKQLETRP